jgi:hypothetical protein
MRNAAAHCGCLAKIGHVAEQDRCRAPHRHDRATQIVDRSRAGDRAHRPLHRSLHDEAARGVQVRAFDCVAHLVERDPAPRHAIGIELHLEFAEVAAETLDRRDAGHCQEAILDLELGEVAQAHQIGRTGLGFERELEDLVQPAGQAREQRRIRSGRELGRRLGHSLRDELTRPVVVGVGLELDRDLRDTELTARADPAHVG